MATYKFHERKRHTLWWIVLIVMTAAALAVGFYINPPTPPRKIILATGPADSSYERFGKQYRDRLVKLGLGVELVQTNGSVDNLNRLLKGEVDLAFVQGGTASTVKDDQGILRGLAAVYREPLWFFCQVPAKGTEKEGDVRIGALGKFFRDKEIKRIAIGPVGSGTAVLARLMLHANGLKEEALMLSQPSLKEGADQLDSGALQAAFMVGMADDAPVKQMFGSGDRGISLLPFNKHYQAYTRVFPYLKPITLPQGSLDLERDIPKKETILLAPAAMLACRKDLHPEVVELVLKEAFAIHGTGDKLDAPGQFPTLEGVDLPVDDTATAYVKTGESFLSRVLPYWALRHVFELRILLLPLLVVWLPYLKVLPALYQWRVNRLLRQHYAALRDLETAINHAGTTHEILELIKEMDNLRIAMEKLSRKVPGHLQDKVYHWRLHVSMVRGEAVERMRKMAAQAASAPAAES